jgi:hypothetical protein
MMEESLTHLGPAGNNPPPQRAYLSCQRQIAAGGQERNELRIAARDALKSWKGEALAGTELRQECGRAEAELREKYLVQHGKLVARG